MAILGQVEITVSSEGQVLKEYDPPSADVLDGSASPQATDPKRIVKYIEATPGANFSINYSASKGMRFGRAKYLVLSTSVDGQAVSSPAVFKKEFLEENESFSDTLTGATTWNGSKSLLSQFCWRKLQTSKSLS